jgi:hypothetical protein
MHRIGGKMYKFVTAGFRLYENKKYLRNVKNIDEAKKIIAGLDESMACVDCDPQDYIVKKGNKIVYDRTIKNRISPFAGLGKLSLKDFIRKS